MSYKIAVATSDGKEIDISFGQAEFLTIYLVDDSGEYRICEQRFINSPKALSERTDCQCGVHKDGCKCFSLYDSTNAELVADCRCVLCRESGAPIKKCLERKAISVFDIQCSVDEAMKKLIAYFDRINNHKRQSC